MILYSNYMIYMIYLQSLFQLSKHDFFLLTSETHSLHYNMYINIKEFTLSFVIK